LVLREKNGAEDLVKELELAATDENLMKAVDRTIALINLKPRDLEIASRIRDIKNSKGYQEGSLKEALATARRVVRTKQNDLDTFKELLGKFQEFESDSEIISWTEAYTNSFLGDMVPKLVEDGSLVLVKQTRT
jgi:DNA-directed RNA polymerase specialized sigma54-like protein